MNLIKFPSLNRTGKVKVSLALVLAVALLLVLVYEIYLAYSYIYLNLVFDLGHIAPANIVRVNLSAYQDTINFLDSQSGYTAPPLSMPRGNPFRP